MNRIITFDPTDRAEQVLEIAVNGKTRRKTWLETSAGAGSRLIRELQKLELTAADELRLVVGPGSYGSLRIAATVCNAAAFLTGVRLFARRVDTTSWQPVESLQPFYAAEPKITPAKCK